MAAINRLDGIPAVFLPPPDPDEDQGECFALQVASEPGGPRPTARSTSDLVSFLAGMYDKMVETGQMKRRPAIFACVNRRGETHIAIADEEIEMAKEAVELYPGDYPVMVERPGGDFP